MKTKDMPHGILAFNFAEALLNGEYDKAHNLLSADLKREYSVSGLKSRFEEMMSIADEFPDVPAVVVLDNSELRNPSLDGKGWAYVAIWTEAVTVTVKPFGQELLITELIWGRP
ncbi:MAG: hypothetical protein ABR865_00855 [Terracidiphilus sp.]